MPFRPSGRNLFIVCVLVVGMIASLILLSNGSRGVPGGLYIASPSIAP